MTTTVKFFAGVLLLLTSAINALAEVHYVDVNSTNATLPYGSWATAATNIQDAVDAAVSGDEIVVTNGNYNTGRRALNAYPFGNNRVVVDKPLVVRSVNGPQFTTINGNRFDRCVYLTNGANLFGFTLTRGFARVGGGAFGGRLDNCDITDNRTSFGEYYYDAYGGGAAYCTLNNCLLTRNAVVAYGTAVGGGAVSCTLNGCTLIDNKADNHFPAPTARAYGGGAAWCTLNNCTLRNNFFGTGGQEFGSGVYNSSLNNCTLTGNTYGLAHTSTLNNCIVSSALGVNYVSCSLNYCCTTPLPASGLGNITNAPLFVDGDLRLQTNSPCINAGLNAFAPTGLDLDGNPRIVGGTVDIGAYEFQSPASTISYAWLQQFNLPIDASTDPADPDGDGVSTFHEWLAGTDPTTPFSSPAQLTITPAGASVILTWSIYAVGFTLESTTNLGSPADWSRNLPAPSVIDGQNTVTNPISGAQMFYHLKH